jgi:hypothetical protein
MTKRIDPRVREYMAKIGANGGRAGKGRPKVRDYKKMGQASGAARRAKSRKKKLDTELKRV